MLIKVKNLTKKFGPFTAVENISFNLAKGEVLGFLGPNGAGKTTTMRMITGFLPPTSGQIMISKHNIQEFPILTKKKIGYVPEGAPLYGEMTVYNFLKFSTFMSYECLRKKFIINNFDTVNKVT